MSKHLPRSGEISNIGSQNHMENHDFRHKIAQKASTKLKKIASGGVALKTTQNNGDLLFNYRIAAKRQFFGGPTFFFNTKFVLNFCIN